MTVKEFSDIIGIPSSKIRFYDRTKIIDGEREGENNYRFFTNSDAFSIYNAQMLRSFNLGIQDVIAAQNENLLQLNSRIYSQIDELEWTIRQQEIKLVRLKEMKRYFEMIDKQHSEVSYQELEDSYNICTINCPSSEEDRLAVKMLSDVMPFSYVCIRISRESIINEGCPLHVSSGLGILNSNKEKIGLNIPSCIPKNNKSSVVRMVLETEDPFSITMQDIRPILDELKKSKTELCEDILGRVFISYKRNGRVVHGLGLSCCIS